MAAARSFEDLLAALRSFQESRALLTAVELDLFSATADWATAAQVAGSTLDARATGMLLNTLVALGAMDKEGDLFRCRLPARGLGPAREGLLHTVNRWHTWSTLTACVRTGTAPGRGPEAQDAAWTESFINAMEARARGLAPALVRQVGTGGVARLLDVGGGPGTFAIAFAQAAPELRAELLDLPAVLPLARRRILAAGLEDRITLRAGDLRVDDLGEGFDVVLLSAICHMLDDHENRELLGRAAKALKPGGRLVLRDFFLEPDRTAPREATLFALNMLVGTRGGNVYTEGEYRDWLTAAGFGEITRPEGGELLLAVRLGPQP